MLIKGKNYFQSSNYEVAKQVYSCIFDNIVIGLLINLRLDSPDHTDL